MWHAVHPKEPHYYLRLLGTQLDVRRRGLGSIALRPVLDRCDKLRIPAYTETGRSRMSGSIAGLDSRWFRSWIYRAAVRTVGRFGASRVDHVFDASFRSFPGRHRRRLNRDSSSRKTLHAGLRDDRRIRRSAMERAREASRGLLEFHETPHAFRKGVAVGPASAPGRSRWMCQQMRREEQYAPKNPSLLPARASDPELCLGSSYSGPGCPVTVVRHNVRSYNAASNHVAQWIRHRLS